MMNALDTRVNTDVEQHVSGGLKPDEFHSMCIGRKTASARDSSDPDRSHRVGGMTDVEVSPYGREALGRENADCLQAPPQFRGEIGTPQ